MSLERDRARRHTARAVLRSIDDQTIHHLGRAADSPAGIQARLDALESEWDIDRTLETEAATMGLISLALGVFVKPKLLAVPATVGASVFLFGCLGIYPLLPIFRRLGIRTSREIQRERYALKAMRGDFAELSTPEERVEGNQAANAPLQ